MIVIRGDDVKEIERKEEDKWFSSFIEGTESNSVVKQPPGAKNATVFGILAFYIEKE